MNKNAQELGKLGGQATVKKYGKEHYSKAGKKGNEKRWGKCMCLRHKFPHNKDLDTMKFCPTDCPCRVTKD